VLWNARRAVLWLLGLHGLEVDLELVKLRLRLLEQELFDLRVPRTPKPPTAIRGKS
jgi:hypothetical protein